MQAVEVHRAVERCWRSRSTRRRLPYPRPTQSSARRSAGRPAPGAEGTRHPAPCSLARLVTRRRRRPSRRRRAADVGRRVPRATVASSASSSSSYGPGNDPPYDPPSAGGRPASGTRGPSARASRQCQSQMRAPTSPPNDTSGHAMKCRRIPSAGATCVPLASRANPHESRVSEPSRDRSGVSPDDGTDVCLLGIRTWRSGDSEDKW